jgi:hypothetical protein
MTGLSLECIVDAMLVTQQSPDCGMSSRYHSGDGVRVRRWAASLHEHREDVQLRISTILMADFIEVSCNVECIILAFRY